MKKKFLSIILIIIIFLQILEPLVIANIDMVLGNPQNTDLGLSYFINDNEVQIIDYVGEEQSIIIPQSIEGHQVTSMDGFSSKDYYDITSMEIPASVININNNIFYGLRGVTNIIVDADNPKYICEDGILYNIDKTEIIKFLAGKKLEEYTVPAEIKKIGERAFYECRELLSLKIEDGVEEIDSLAFCGCANLNTIEVPNSVNNIAENAFDCSGYNLTIYGEKDSYIEVYAQVHNINFVDINAEPEPEEEVDFEYYEGTDTITVNKYTGNSPDVVIPEKIKGKLVTEINLGTFGKYSYITSITIPSGVSEISKYTLTGMKYLENIIVDENNQTYSSVDGVLLNKEKTELIAYPIAKKSEQYTIPNGVTKIDRYSFDGEFADNISLETVVIPQSVNNIGTIAFFCVKNLQAFVVDENNQTYSSEDGILFSKDKKTLVKYPAGKDGDSYIINSNVQNIGDNSFEYCQYLEEIVVPDGVKKIGNWAFANEKVLQKLKISYTVTEISLSEPISSQNENFVLYVYDNSEALKFAQNRNINYEIIEEEDYSNFTYTIQNGEVTIKQYKGNEINVKIPSKINRKPVTKIGISAFGCCYDIESITIPDGVTEIGNSAFCYCSSLKSINIPEGVVKIDNSAFRDCKNLENLVLPDSINEIGKFAFYGCEKFTDVLLPPNVTEINESTYGSCFGLTEVVIPDRITKLGKYAFFNCSNLKKITLPDGLKNFDDYVFDHYNDLIIYGYTNSYSEDYAQSYNINFESIGISATRFVVTFKDYDGTILNVQKVEKGENAVAPERPTREGYTFEYWDRSFDNITESIEVRPVYSKNKFDYVISNDEVIITSYLEYDEEVTIPEEIGGYTVTGIAGLGQTLITKLNIPKTINKIAENMLYKSCIDLECINVDSENEAYSSENGILYNKDKTVLIQYPIAKKDEEYEFLNSVTKVNNYAFSDCKYLKKVIMKDNVNEIGKQIFKECEKLSEVILSKNINKMPEYTFLRCYNLTKVEIPEGVTELEYGVFASCTSLERMVMPDSVRVIDAGLFTGCTNLKYVKLSDNIEILPSSIFNNCNKLDNVVFPSKLKKINDYAFTNWKGAKEIILPDGVEEIGNNAINNCDNLEKLIIPDSVVSMDNFSIILCPKLYDVKLSSGLTIINNIFAECPSLTDITIPNGVEKLNGTFQFCRGLTSITIPRSVTAISDNTFANKNILTIYGEKGSYAEVYAKYNKITFKLLSEKEEVQDVDITPGMFNSTYYADMNKDVKNAFGYDEAQLRNHYLNYGIDEGRKASPIFDAKYYKEKNNDLKGLSNRELYNHFINFGIKEGRQASKYFSVVYYKNKYEDLRRVYKNSYTNYASHFANYGLNEGRIGSSEFNVIEYIQNCSNYEIYRLKRKFIKYYALVQGADVIEEVPIDITNYMFDGDLYFNLYPDLQRAIGYDVVALREHYINFGLKEGRVASYIFDPAYYLNNNKDVKKAFGAKAYEMAYNHFVNYGVNEGRQGSKYFGSKFYLNKYTDIGDSYGKNYSRILEHFANYGINEGRQGSSEFNVNAYKQKNSDLNKAFGNKWKEYYKHYIIWGQKENRKCV